MLNRQVKDLLDEFKRTQYDVYEIKHNERIDHVLYNKYGDNSLAYLKLFAYLNNIIYINEELEAGDIVKFYDLDIFINIAKQNNIDVTSFIYK